MVSQGHNDLDLKNNLMYARIKTYHYHKYPFVSLYEDFGSRQVSPA